MVERIFKISLNLSIGRASPCNILRLLLFALVHFETIEMQGLRGSAKVVEKIDWRLVERLREIIWKKSENNFDKSKK